MNVRFILSAHAILPVVATVWEEPRFSPHRSKRLWKKLRLRSARPHPGEPRCYRLPDGSMVIHPVLFAELKRQTETYNPPAVRRMAAVELLALARP